MPRTFAAAVLLATLAFLPRGTALAGPPEGASGKMTFDEVADGLRKFRKERDPETRVKWLEKLAPTRDPRVAVVLGEAMSTPPVARGGVLHFSAEWWPSYELLDKYYLPPEFGGPPAEEVRTTTFEGGRRVMRITRKSTGRGLDAWWKKNEADLRRRAAQLPR